MNHLQTYLAEEFVEDYQEGRISRRQALKRLASLTGSVMLAQSFLAACALPPEATATAPPAATQPPATQPAASATPSAAPAASATGIAASATPAATGSQAAPANTQFAAGTGAAPAGTVTADDPAVFAEAVEFPGEDGATVQGYLAYPSNEGTYPVVLVCHENRGLTAHIQDVTRRFAKAGYAALAVDLLSRQGGSGAVGESGAAGALGGNSPEQMVGDFRSGWNWLNDKAFADTARVGMVGFCFGGGITWQVATQVPELKAAVPFYGPPPAESAVPNIQAAVLAVYGGRDTRITSTQPAIEAAMQANGKTYSKLIYTDADHAFFNDTGTRYNDAAAHDAWAQVLAWFGEYLV
ncbi:MAG TPA: dienelactone hydrolase family protein [Chloroflexia bacterium]|nr:dienelactone hydrolase family protein [Chloroflexia bacterium]